MMDSIEARALLGLYRPGVDDADPRVAEAFALAGQDVELSRWRAQEQALDAALAAKLKAVPVPPELKSNLLALSNVVEAPADRWRKTWLPALASAAAAALMTWLAALVFLHPIRSTTVVRVPAPAPGVDSKTDAGSLENFRAEMISFVKLAPPLEFESHDADKLKDFLQREQGPANMRVPDGLLRLPGMGCRMLSFRGHKVALMCFLRQNGQLVHLIVVDRTALPDLKSTRAQPVVGPEGAWMTAAWKQDDLAYLVAVKGDVPLLNSYLAHTIEPLPYTRTFVYQSMTTRTSVSRSSEW